MSEIGSDGYELLDDFESFSPEVRKGIDELGWKRPMEVQRRVIPIVRAGRDLIVQAMTGSGKTGAFGLPVVERIDPELKKPQALVLSPTRELALQIEKEVRTMGRGRGIESVAVYGGTAYGPQLDAFARGAQVVVGTPGRLLDHLGSGALKLDRLQVLIFDEADELLSLGFWPDMKEIQRYVPKRRITGLFSATMPQRVMSLARVFLDDPVYASLVKPEDQAPAEIEHYHYIVTAQSKDKELLRILQYEDPDSAIVFCNTRADVRYLAAFLQRNHLDADMIQGEMTQAAREQVMRRIKAGELRFLVATDVAARGIDISDLSHVISYAAPESPEIYLHRTGRTGRAGKRGTAISLVSGLDVGNFRALQQINRIDIPERPIPSDEEVGSRTLARLEVLLNHELRELPERERGLRQEQHLPLVQTLAATPDGQRLLSAVLFQWLDRRHVPAPGDPASAAAAGSGDAATRADAPRAARPPEDAEPRPKRRRRPRRGRTGERR